MALVVDASVAMGWVLRTQATQLSNAALSVVVREFGWVPRHFAIELARALRSHERRNLLAADIVDRALAGLRALPIREDTSNAIDRLQDIVTLTRRHGLRIADAAYLELALRTALPLATRDRSLARAA